MFLRAWGWSWRLPHADSSLLRGGVSVETTWGPGSLSHVEHRFALPVTSWHLRVIVMLSSSRHRITDWKGAKDSRHFHGKRRKGCFQHYSWEGFCGSTDCRFWDSCNRPGISLLFRRCPLVPGAGEPVITECCRDKGERRKPEVSNYP